MAERNLDEQRKKMIRSRMLVQFIDLIRDDVTMVQINAAIDNVLDAIDRQVSGQELADSTYALQHAHEGLARAAAFPGDPGYDPTKEG